MVTAPACCAAPKRQVLCKRRCSAFTASDTTSLPGASCPTTCMLYCSRSKITACLPSCIPGNHIRRSGSTASIGEAALYGNRKASIATSAMIVTSWRRSRTSRTTLSRPGWLMLRTSGHGAVPAASFDSAGRLPAPPEQYRSHRSLLIVPAPVQPYLRLRLASAIPPHIPPRGRRISTFHDRPQPPCAPHCLCHDLRDLRDPLRDAFALGAERRSGA